MRRQSGTLRPYRYIRLTTFRKSGEAVPTPVWFVAHERALYVQTGTRAGKARRIRSNPHVTLAPCTSWGRPRGPSVPAVATDLGPAAPAHIRTAFLRRYGPLQWLRELALRRRGITSTILEIIPTGPEHV